MEVLGVNPIPRLVFPRIMAFMVVSVGLFGLVCVVGLTGSYVFSSTVQNASPGLFVANLTLLIGFQEFLVSLLKAALFGIAAGLVACFLGLHAKGGPKGVGDAVNQTVVFTLMVLVVINTLTTTVYIQLRGGA